MPARVTCELVASTRHFFPIRKHIKDTCSDPYAVNSIIKISTCVVRLQLPICHVCRVSVWLVDGLDVVRLGFFIAFSHLTSFVWVLCAYVLFFVGGVCARCVCSLRNRHGFARTLYGHLYAAM